MHEFVGKWRITHMDLWSPKMVDLLEAGHFQFYAHGQGHFIFSTIKGRLDVRINSLTAEIEFSWEGEGQKGRLSGRGKIEFVSPYEGQGTIYIHNSDQSAFTVKRVAAANVVQFVR